MFIKKYCYSLVIKMRKRDKIGLCSVILAGAFALNYKGIANFIHKKYIMPNQIQTQIEPQYSQDAKILARAIFGEARGGSEELKIAVAQTILNRVRDNRWPNTLEKVILQPRQFSCFNENDLNYPKVQNPEAYEPEIWQECLGVAQGVLKGRYRDLANGANHYHTNAVNPSWSRGEDPVNQIENTLFFNL